ncbi:hypothetical protein [Marinomonas sp.]|uniref:hypothetical protein n=1 Tax=Marinomonas sp. TaxID=1904862 RepID=UPI003F98E0B2
MHNPDYVLDKFKILLVKVSEEIKKPTENFDLNERNYKRNMGRCAQIDVSTIYRRLTSIFEEIDELKMVVALENGFYANQFDYQGLVRQFCADYQNVVKIAGSIKIFLDERSGLLGFLKGYSNPIEIILSGKSHKLNYQQLRGEFSYYAVILQNSEKKILDDVAKDLDRFMLNFIQ